MSVATSIFSSNTAIVCVLGWILLNESFSLLKFIAVCLAIVGVVVISMDKEFNGSVYGISLVIICAFAAAFYKVLFKWLNGNATLGQVSLFMSSLGLLNLIINFLPTVILVSTNYDYIEWNYVPWASLIAIALLSLTFNFLVNFGIALLGPLVISVGMVFGQPLSIAIDILFRDLNTNWHFWIGAICITISFILTTISFEEIFQSRRIQKSRSLMDTPPNNISQNTN